MTRFRGTTALVAATLMAVPALADAPYEVEILAEGLDRPWGMAFLPGSQDLIITKRGGAVAIWHHDSGEVTEVSGAPEVVSAGQGGLLDIAPAPDFEDSQMVYMTWVAAHEDGQGTTTHLGRAVLDRDGGALSDLDVLHVVSPGVDSGGHFGSRIVFQDGHVFVGFGDRNFKDFGPDHIAQDLSSENGAVIRLTMDGDIPEDNPFVDVDGAAGAIWSYGHRNIQAMAVHPDTGDIWLAEHGEAGGDEVNLVQRGGNYGWPLAAFGVDYRTGEQFANPHQEGDGFVMPAYHWPPGRDAHFPPSGMAFYDGEAFPDWQGRMLIGNLFHRYIGVFAVDGDQVSSPERLVAELDLRIREIEVGPEDGFIYVIADGGGVPLFRLVPASDD
ncbi:MAG: PQQ-dependent sugar dehydrogenase [Rhodobacteraceae bacterium]|nr:PQQ-dependent sugar dehydrogenase [Paracoccaceae bacterium]